MDNFIQEIDEELKRERQLALWRKYGRFVVGGAFAIVIAVAAVVGWRQYQANARTEAGLAYQSAVDVFQAGQTEAALSQFRALAENAPEGYAEIARLQVAAALQRQGDAAGATAILDEMANDSGKPEAIRNVALLLYGYAAMDSADSAQLTARLQRLTGEGNPWRYSALEITALLARKQGDSAKAEDIFKRLSDDPSTPPSVRARAAEFLALTQTPGGK